MLANYYAKTRYDDDDYIIQNQTIVSSEVNPFNIINNGIEKIDKKILGGETGVFIVKNKNWRLLIVNIKLHNSYTSTIIPRDFEDKEIVVDVMKYYKKAFKYKIYAVVKLLNIGQKGHFDLMFVNTGFYKSSIFRKRTGDSSYYISSVLII